MKKSDRKKGFTMVELIVVIVIILVLAAVLVPSLLKYISKSQEATCRENKHSLYIEVVSAYAIGEYDSIQEAFDDTYKSTISYCPSGGTYTFESTSVDDGKIVCSKHDSDDNSNGNKYGNDMESYIKQNQDLLKEISSKPPDPKVNQWDELRKQFQNDRGGNYPSLTSEEKSILNKVSEDVLSNLSWKPTITNNKEIMMIASSDNQKNMAYMVYYNGVYYYHTNGNGKMDNKFVSDQIDFDTAVLESDPQWVKVQ